MQIKLTVKNGDGKTLLDFPEKDLKSIYRIDVLAGLQKQIREFSAGYSHASVDVVLTTK